MAKAVVLKKAVRPAPHVAPLRPKKNSDPTVQTWRALAPLRVGDPDGETTHMRYFGDFVPEAAGWKNTAIYMKTGQLELAYVNQSEIDAWREEYESRTSQEDEEKQAAEEKAQEIAELEKRIAALRGKGARKVPDFNAPPTPERREAPLEERIDYTKPVQELGKVDFTTRAPASAASTGEVRKRPTTVRKVVRKKG